MWNKWTKLCEASQRHYNEHRGRHLALTAVWFVGGTVATLYAARKAADDINGLSHLR